MADVVFLPRGESGQCEIADGTTDPVAIGIAARIEAVGGQACAPVEEINDIAAAAAVETGDIDGAASHEREQAPVNGDVVVGTRGDRRVVVGRSVRIEIAGVSRLTGGEGGENAEVGESSGVQLEIHEGTCRHRETPCEGKTARAGAETVTRGEGASRVESGRTAHGTGAGERAAIRGEGARAGLTHAGSADLQSA